MPNDFSSLKPNKAYIINLQNHNENGSHWVAIYKSHYFDSYGVVPTVSVSRYAKYYNVDQYQSLEQESCGYMAMYAIKNMMAGHIPMVI